MKRGYLIGLVIGLSMGQAKLSQQHASVQQTGKQTGRVIKKWAARKIKQQLHEKRV